MYNIIHNLILVGPGEYEDIDQRKYQGGVISSEQPRLKITKNTTPGPGSYQVKNGFQSIIMCT